MVKLNKEKLLSGLTKEQLIQLDTYFPNIIDAKILNYSPLAYKISLLGNDIAGYVLGFPIQNMIPTEEQIHQCIALLTKLGVQEYIKYIKEYNKLTYTPISPLNLDEKIIYANEHDVITEDIDNYVSFDIVSYQIGPHMYRFSRAEFSQLAKSKENPWTNDGSPPPILSTIIARRR